MTSPPDPMADALAAVAYITDPHSDDLDVLHPTSLPQAMTQLSAAVFIAHELANHLAEYMVGGPDGDEPQLGTEEWATWYKRREETRQKLMDIMRQQHVASKFQGGEQK